jgi:hypothetical protein
MGVIEDLRKVMQDFLAPELHAIKERLKNVETSQGELKTELKDFRQQMERLFEKSEQNAQIRYKELVTQLNLEARMKNVEEKTRLIPPPVQRDPQEQ